MKKFLATMSTIIMMFLLAFSFSGCNSRDLYRDYLFYPEKISYHKYTGFIENSSTITADIIVASIDFRVNRYFEYYQGYSNFEKDFYIFSTTKIFPQWHWKFELVGNDWGTITSGKSKILIPKDDIIHVRYYMYDISYDTVGKSEIFELSLSYRNIYICMLTKYLSILLIVMAAVKATIILIIHFFIFLRLLF